MRLADIKDADGKEGLLPEKVPESPRDFDSSEGYNNCIDELSQRQVGVEVDRFKLIEKIRVWSGQPESHNSLISGMDIPSLADAIIAHKKELFKIIYVKD